MRRLATLLFSAALATTAVSASATTLEDVILAERAGTCHALESMAPPQSAIEAELVDAHLARCLMDEGHFEAALAALDRVDWSLAHTGHELDSLSWLPELYARAQLHHRNPLGALSAYRSLVRDANPGAVDQGSRARVLYYLALAYEASGNLAEAVTTYRRLAHEYPASTYVSRVNVLLLQDALSPAEQLDLADSARRGRHYDLAERLYTQVACPNLIGRRWIADEGFEGETCHPRDAVLSGDPLRYEAAYQLGFLLYRYRREFYERGLPWLERLAMDAGPRSGDAVYGIASALTRAERYDEALEAWERLRREHPSHRGAHEGAWMLGELPLMADDHEAAIEGQRAYLEAYPEGRYRSLTQWHLGWSHYRLGDREAAMAAWAPLAGRRTWDDQVTYWRAVCESELGDGDAAEAGWRELVEDDPFSYYGVLAALRLGEPVLREPLPQLDDEAWRAELNPPSLLVVRIAELGLIDEANLLERFDHRVTRPAAAEQWEMVVEADRADWSRWRRRHRDRLSEAPGSVDDLAAMRLALPGFYRVVVERAAEANGLPPGLIWSIMRRESSYDRYAISRSDAMGLMQVIPQTATQISIALEERYVDGMLFEPYHAVRYGSWYLGALAEMFDGQIPLAAGAYNAGPIAMMRWVDRNGGMPFDAFVEEIPYEQARTYIKRVLTTLVRYEVAWGNGERIAPETLEALFPTTVTSTYGEGVRF